MSKKIEEFLMLMHFGNWTSKKKKVSDTEIVETYTGDIQGRIRTVVNTEGKPILIEGTLNGVSVKKEFTYNSDGSILVSQEVN